MLAWQSPCVYLGGDGGAEADLVWRGEVLRDKKWNLRINSTVCRAWKMTAFSTTSSGLTSFGVQGCERESYLSGESVGWGKRGAQGATYKEVLTPRLLQVQDGHMRAGASSTLQLGRLSSSRWSWPWGSSRKLWEVKMVDCVRDAYPGEEKTPWGSDHNN